ncbi:hypothetical protein EV126DRAFT_344718, partial [Verticillium dahliae]
KVIALSIYKAKYIALYEASKEAIYIFSIFLEISKGLGLNKPKILTLLIDNKGAKKITKNPKFYKRVKYIDR